jgi:hypothetical protein
MKKQIVTLIATFGATASWAQAPDSSGKLLAVCGASKGMAYYVTPQEKGWETDAISGGSVTFTLDTQLKPDLIIKDAFGKSFSSRERGSTVVLMANDEKFRNFSILVLESDGTGFGAYQVIEREDNSRVLLWTNTKNRVAGLITKVSAYVSACE